MSKATASSYAAGVADFDSYNNFNNCIATKLSSNLSVTPIKSKRIGKVIQFFG